MTRVARRKYEPPPLPPLSEEATPRQRRTTPPTEQATESRDTRGFLPNRDRSNYRFLRTRTHTSVRTVSMWYVVDLLDSTLAFGTNPDGYLDEEDARQAQARCGIDQGAWM